MGWRHFHFFAGGRGRWIESSCRKAAAAIDAADRFLFMRGALEPVVTLSVERTLCFSLFPPSASLERSHALRLLRRSRAASRLAEITVGFFLAAVFGSLHWEDVGVTESWLWSHWRRLLVLNQCNQRVDKSVGLHFMETTMINADAIVPSVVALRRLTLMDSGEPTPMIPASQCSCATRGFVC